MNTTKSIRSLLTGTLLFTAATVAQALPITDTFTPSGAPVILTTGTDYSFQHSLLTHGFDPLADTLTNATLTLSFGNRANGNAITVTLDLDATTYGQMNQISGIPIAVDLSFLQDDGLLDVVLKKGGGGGSTFDFYSSVLFVEGRSNPTTNPPTGVPEPVSFGLLGIGLLGMAMARRRIQ